MPNSTGNSPMILPAGSFFKITPVVRDPNFVVGIDSCFAYIGTAETASSLDAGKTFTAEESRIAAHVDNMMTYPMATICAPESTLVDAMFRMDYVEVSASVFRFCMHLMASDILAYVTILIPDDLLLGPKLRPHAGWDELNERTRPILRRPFMNRFRIRELNRALLSKRVDKSKTSVRGISQIPSGRSCELILMARPMTEAAIADDVEKEDYFQVVHPYGNFCFKMPCGHPKRPYFESLRMRPFCVDVSSLRTVNILSKTVSALVRGMHPNPTSMTLYTCEKSFVDCVADVDVLDKSD